MGMSTYVQAYISPDDETYKKHSAVLRACIHAEVSLPKETAEYFGTQYAEEYLFDEKLEIEIPVIEWSDEYSSSGFEILVKDIPIGTYKIRFVNSW